jgi:hypothetical protein
MASARVTEAQVKCAGWAMLAAIVAWVIVTDVLLGEDSPLVVFGGAFVFGALVGWLGIMWAARRSR